MTAVLGSFMHTKLLTFFFSTTAPADYTSIISVVTIQYDLVRLFFVMPSSAMVMVVDDDVPEESEEVTLSLTSGTAFGFRDIVRISPPSARLVIQNDDGKPSQARSIGN